MPTTVPATPNKRRSKWIWLPREARKDKTESSLAFTDILFGLVLAEMFQRGNQLASITWSGRAHLAVALVLVTTSWIGYHNSRKRTKYQSQFFNLPLGMFALDLGMVFIYWLVALNPEGVPELRSTPAFGPSALLETNLVLVVFCLYSLWDLGARWMSRRMIAGVKKYPEATHDATRTLVTLVCFVIVACIAVAVWRTNPTTGSSVALVDVILVSILIVYRFAKDGLRPSSTEPETSS